jgi:hypothetical protein
MTYTGDTHWLLSAPWGKQPSTSAHGHKAMALHRGPLPYDQTFSFSELVSDSGHAPFTSPNPHRQRQ